MTDSVTKHLHIYCHWIFTSDLGGRQSPHHNLHFTETKTIIQLSDLFKIIQPVQSQAGGQVFCY